MLSTSAQRREMNNQRWKNGKSGLIDYGEGKDDQ